MLKRIKQIDGLWKKIIICLMALFSTAIIFPAGMINTESQMEVCAEFFAALTKNHTKGKTYSAMIVEAKDDSKKKLADTSFEFYDLYGSFRTDRACFANTVNLNKEKNIRLDNCGIDNLSLLYTTSGLNVWYVEDYGWRHEFYPLTMMYDAPKSERPPAISNYCFISKTQAEYLLKSNFLGEPVSEPFTLEDYKKIQYKSISLTCDSRSVSHCILGIYLEEGYYYDALKEIMGDFVFTYGPIPASLPRQAVYFMRDYSYQNKHYINYAKSRYELTDYDYKIGTFNLLDDYAYSENITQLIFPSFSNVYSTLLFVLSTMLLIVALFLVWILDIRYKWYEILILCSCMVVPYVAFKTVSMITENVGLFTGLSTMYNMISLIAAFVLLIIIFFVKKSKRKAFHE